MSETTVAYDLQEEDLLRFFDHLQRTSRRWLGLRYAVGIGTPVLAGFAIGPIASHRAGPLIWAILGALTLVLLYMLGGATLNRAAWRTRIREGKRFLLGARRLTLDSGGVRRVSPYVETKVRWAAIRRIDEDREYVYFVIVDSGFAVPKRAFETPREAEAFCRTARELHRAGSTAEGTL